MQHEFVCVPSLAHLTTCGIRPSWTMRAADRAARAVLFMALVALSVQSTLLARADDSEEADFAGDFDDELLASDRPVVANELQFELHEGDVQCFYESAQANEEIALDFQVCACPTVMLPGTMMIVMNVR